MKKEGGFSLLEVLVVLTVFSFLALISTQAILSTLRLSKKSSSLAKVRGEVDYAMSIVERHIHNAKTVSPCPNTNQYQIDYEDQRGVAARFSCVGVGDEGSYIASGSARLTSDSLVITSCKLSCLPEVGVVPQSVVFELEAREKTETGVQSVGVTTSTQIYLRSF